MTQLRPARGIRSPGATCLLFWSLSAELWILEWDRIQKDRSGGIGTMHHHKRECVQSLIVNSSRVEGRRQRPPTNHIRGRDSTGKTESRKCPKLQLGKPKGMYVSFSNACLQFIYVVYKCHSYHLFVYWKLRDFSQTNIKWFNWYPWIQVYISMKDYNIYF